MTFSCGAGPLLRTCVEGEWQHLPRRASGVWGSGVWSKALGEGVWVGFRSSALEGVLEGVSECRGRALGVGVGAGLGLCMAGGRLGGQRIRPGRPTGFPVPKWTGKALALFPSVLSCRSPTVSPSISPVAAGPLTVGGSRWV